MVATAFAPNLITRTDKAHLLTVGDEVIAFNFIACRTGQTNAYKIINNNIICYFCVLNIINKKTTVITCNHIAFNHRIL